jgi:hypothetical protein
MGINISLDSITDEKIYPIKNPNPADTVESIISGLTDIENEIDSPQVNSEVTELETGGIFFNTSARTCLHIKLRDTKVSELKKMGVVIFPAEFGNLVYLVQYEYIDMGWGFSTRDEIVKKAKEKLNTIEKWIEYTFIQTLGDYVYVELLKKYDTDFDANLRAYSEYLTRN